MLRSRSRPNAASKEGLHRPAESYCLSSSDLSPTHFFFTNKGGQQISPTRTTLVIGHRAGEQRFGLPMSSSSMTTAARQRTWMQEKRHLERVLGDAIGPTLSQPRAERLNFLADLVQCWPERPPSASGASSSTNGADRSDIAELERVIAIAVRKAKRTRSENAVVVVARSLRSSHWPPPPQSPVPHPQTAALPTPAAPVAHPEAATVREAMRATAEVADSAVAAEPRAASAEETAIPPPPKGSMQKGAMQGSPDLQPSRASLIGPPTDPTQVSAESVQRGPPRHIDLPASLLKCIAHVHRGRAFAHYTCTWHMHMAHAHSTRTWHTHMAHAHSLTSRLPACSHLAQASMARSTM